MIATGSSTCRLGRLGLAAGALVGVSAFALATGVAAAGAAAPARPQRAPSPQKLWQAFPLDVPRAVRPRPATARPAPATPRTATTSARPGAAGDAGLSTLELAALALLGAVVAIAVAGGTLVYGRRHSAGDEAGVAPPVPAPTREPRARAPQPAPLPAARAAPAQRARPAARRRPLLDAALRIPVGTAAQASASETIQALITASRPPRASARRRARPPRERASEGAGGGTKQGPGPVENARKGADAAAPKRGAAGSSDTDRLKAKLASRAGSGSARDADELKAKLKRAKPAARAPEAVAETRQADPAADALQPDSARDRARLRPVPSASDEPARADTDEPPTCRIELWRGYTKAHFYAAPEVPVAGGEDELATASPSFRWWRSGPPPRNRADVAAAHSSLLETLTAAGWTPIGQGEEWFALKLRRGPQGTAPDDRAGGADANRTE